MSQLVFTQGDTTLIVDPLDNDVELPITGTCDNSTFTIYLKAAEAKELAKFITEQMEKQKL